MSVREFNKEIAINNLIPEVLFHKAEKFLRDNGYGREIDWCDNRPTFDDVDERYFLLEYGWVVFNSGMRNKVIEAKWSDLKNAFHQFIPYRIVVDEDEVRKTALLTFGNVGKVEAVITVAKKIVTDGFETTFRTGIEKDALEFLDSLPFIGKVTKFHLARNLGFDYIKPDRHLVRLAKRFGTSPFDLCDRIHKATGRRLGTIDVVLWRFCERKGQSILPRKST